MSSGMRFCMAFIVLAALACGSMAATINVDESTLADWGVSLAQQPNGSFMSSSFTPKAGVNYVTGYNILVDRGTPYNYATDPTDFYGHGGELCDIEAAYVTFDTSNVYFAIVTSANPNGTTWDGYGNDRFGPGDLNVTVTKGTQSTDYGIGARPVNLTYYGAISDIWGPGDNRSMVTWDGATTTNGTFNAAGATSTPGTYFTTSEAEVRSSPAWSWVDNPGTSLQAYFEGGTKAPGSLVGQVSASWYQVYTTGYTYPGDPYAHQNPYGTWIYQVAVPLSDLGLNQAGAMLTSMSFGMDCGNDILAFSNVTFGAPPPVPEPVTAIFFATGVVGVLGFAARRRMLRKA